MQDSGYSCLVWFFGANLEEPKKILKLKQITFAVFLSYTHHPRWTMNSG